MRNCFRKAARVKPLWVRVPRAPLMIDLSTVFDAVESVVRERLATYPVRFAVGQARNYHNNTGNTILDVFIEDGPPLPTVGTPIVRPPFRVVLSSDGRIGVQCALDDYHWETTAVSDIYEPDMMQMLEENISLFIMRNIDRLRGRRA